ncbi:helix-turn-helix domain-containing protein [Phreatobacter sp. AB_2022a]|uniref:helix-turn-helix domain-containing protein n=1 Tax=Phreatobacter sp. AB_2022a TaxID=3003134 RepID=UPI00056FCEC4|nr:helix-turn-helix transcriptional regulator [Phreatobacter sp. AB_2022a]MCZ0738329.1 helix-turn-helix transcriptional regulator [Phreatobacter sp. AB_2022a]CEJ11428.1 helix-turn-helix protein [bacterium YEK0313]
MSVKNPSPVDRHVGTRVRMRRMMLGISQEKLGERLGLTFQQVQKYEKGVNRIGASRLMQMSGILGVPVSFFFEDAPSVAEVSDDKLPTPGALLVVPGAIQLLQAYARIEDPALRRSLVHIAEGLAPAAN